MTAVADLFAVLSGERDDEVRLAHLVELGRGLVPLDEAEVTDANRVRGCASRTWLVASVEGTGPDAVLRFRGASDAHLVRGLVRLALALHDGLTACEVLAVDAAAAFGRAGLGRALTRQRTNGLAAMVARMREVAEAAITRNPSVGVT